MFVLTPDAAARGRANTRCGRRERARGPETWSKAMLQTNTERLVEDKLLALGLLLAVLAVASLFFAKPGPRPGTKMTGHR